MIPPERFTEITSAYSRLRIGVLGDFCLDRYLEVDPSRGETSIETGLPVHNVVRVRPQPGAAGTILNNLVALGIGELWPIGFAGDDGEGFELCRELERLPNVRIEHFQRTDQRRTFTYCKPLVIASDDPPRELSRLDSKNWSPTPVIVEDRILASVANLLPRLDALVLMDQVDVADTGVLTLRVIAELKKLLAGAPRLIVVADSRRGLRGYPPVVLKMNRTELGAMLDAAAPVEVEEVRSAAVKLAKATGRPVFVTLAEAGMVAADPTGETFHRPALPTRGSIDIVGAGDAVAANLTAALAAGASLAEALNLASVAASVVIHQLGTTGTATIPELRRFATDCRP